VRAFLHPLTALQHSVLEAEAAATGSPPVLPTLMGDLVVVVLVMARVVPPTLAAVVVDAGDKQAAQAQAARASSSSVTRSVWHKDFK